jgi:hypothetical protein
VQSRHVRRVLAAALVLAAGIALAVLCRDPLLRSAGTALIAEDPLGRADVIVLTLDVGAAGVLEASDLVRAGFATRVAVFADAPSPIDAEFARRGFRVEGNSAVWLRMLGNLGVRQREQIPIAENGTHAESEVLPGWCKDNGVHAVIVVTSPDHSRRVRRTLRRTMIGHPVRVMVHAARFSAFKRDQWWLTPDGVRIGLVEWEKLIVDFVRHPLS